MSIETMQTHLFVPAGQRGAAGRWASQPAVLRRGAFARSAFVLGVVAVAAVSLVTAGSATAQLRHVSPKVRVPPDDLTPLEREASDLYRRVLPAVVTILTEGIEVTHDGPQRTSGLGTGVLLQPDCHILTAAHVVEGARRITVRTQDGIEREAVHLNSTSGGARSSSFRCCATGGRRRSRSTRARRGGAISSRKRPEPR